MKIDYQKQKYNEKYYGNLATILSGKAFKI